MTQGQYHKLHTLLIQMRSENENNYNELRDDNQEINQKLDTLKVDVETIADNTGCDTQNEKNGVIQLNGIGILLSSAAYQPT